MPNASSSATTARRQPSRLDLFWLTVQMHGRLIVWVGGLLLLTFGLATFGILSTITVGDPIAHSGTVIGVPSSQSLHVQVELTDGNRLMVPRGEHDGVLVGDTVKVLETSSALGSTAFRLSAVGGR